ncbi:hypothetical protein [Rhodococcus opacus]|uniref:hypothetical protein n=1 Tax=Rhodococcus opacus TaxID=37919 RepID=UPI0029495E4B|nr:hypothetical protein [Rhodococcus opacus]MDV6246883.1 hypothetical protein [Rhodococcus opacus]
MDIPRITAEDRKHAVSPLSRQDAKRVASKVDRYRQENPDEFHTWDTARGSVFQYRGWRFYYGSCRDCSDLVTKSRDISRYKDGPTNLGRWPVLCPPCRTANSQRIQAANLARIRALRAEEKAKRDTQREKYGLPQITPGYRSDLYA